MTEKKPELPKDGIYYDMYEELYRSLPFANYSAVKVLAQGLTPAHYKAVQSGDSYRTRAKDFGTAVHSALLSNDLELIQPLPEHIKKRRGEDWDDLQLANPGVEYLPKSEYAKHETIKNRAYRARDAVLDHPVAKTFFDDFHPEVVLIWTDEYSGIRCKGRVDCLAKDGSLMADPKTTSKRMQYQMAKSGYYLGYHIQAAMYTDGYAAITGNEIPFYFVFIESEPPHLVVPANGHSAFDERTDADSDKGYLELGREQYRAALMTIARCTESGEWDGYPMEVMDMVIPKFAGMEGVYDV